MSSLTPTAIPAATKAPPPSEVQPFGSYLLLHAFARGGMGEVYLARLAGGVNEDQYCVLKKLRPELTQDGEYVRRFIDEARVVVQLHHPNICHVFDVGRVADEYYLAMEYVSGHDARSLQNRARDLGRPLPAGCVLHLVCEILEALDYAHQRNHPITGESLHLIHRDVSPQNVLVRYDGAVKLIDFGLASSKLKMERTQPNVVMGKMAYMAPEQARGEGIDSSIDLFAVAVLTYELLTGHRFYEDMIAQEIWAVVGRGDFVPRHWSKLPAGIGKILSRALHAKVEKRFPSAQEFRQALLRHLDKEYPEAGQEQLSVLMKELFAEEEAREAQMMERLEQASSGELSEAMEASRSLSISLAQSEYSKSVAIAAGGPVPDSDLAADAKERQARLTKSLNQSLGEAQNPEAKTSFKLLSSGEINQSQSSEATEATQLRMDAFQNELKPRENRLASGALIVLLICFALGGAYWLGVSTSKAVDIEPVRSGPVTAAAVLPGVVPAKERSSTPEKEVVREARRAQPEKLRTRPVKKSVTTTKRLRRKNLKSAKRSPAKKQSDVAVAANARASVAVVPAQPENKPVISAKAPPPPVSQSSTAQVNVPEVKKRDPNTSKARREKSARAKSTKTKSQSRQEDSKQPAWRSLSRRERLGLLKSCSNSCRKDVSGAFVRLKIKTKNASAADRRDAEKTFDDMWKKCFEVCSP